MAFAWELDMSGNCQDLSKKGEHGLACKSLHEQMSQSDRTNRSFKYFVIAMGGTALIMFIIRFVCFSVFESPKFLMGKGRDEDAVRVVHEVARRNGKTSTLTLEDLTSLNRLGGD